MQMMMIHVRFVAKFSLLPAPSLIKSQLLSTQLYSSATSKAAQTDFNTVIFGPIFSSTTQLQVFSAIDLAAITIISIQMAMTLFKNWSKIIGAEIV